MKTKAQPRLLKLTERAKQELTYHLSHCTHIVYTDQGLPLPTSESACEEYVRWVCWCLCWGELTKAQASELNQTIIRALMEEDLPVHESLLKLDQWL